MQRSSSPAAVVLPGRERESAATGYDFCLPAESIAQWPSAERDASRLMVVDPRTGDRRHVQFRDIGRFLRGGDVLVLNDSKVIRARLRGRKQSGGAVEALLVERESADQWAALVRTSRRPAPGATIEFAAGLRATWVGDQGGGRASLRFAAEGDLEAALDRAGEVPLPPYIRRPFGPDAVDSERYQTVYARVPGSIAAPTAGLHFTGELMADLAREGIDLVSITLHVGPATFRRVEEEQHGADGLAGEYYVIPEETVSRIVAARAAGRRVIAVGTTTTRALEAAAEQDGILRPGAGVATTLIRPGHRFRTIDGLITNFHLPRSSPLLLVTAVLGDTLVRQCYQEALSAGYRFYSYGDAMLAIYQGHDPSPAVRTTGR